VKSGVPSWVTKSCINTTTKNPNISLFKMLTPEKEQYLESIWTDPKHPAAYSGPNKFYQLVRREGKYKIGLATIRQFLSDKDAYSLQKRVQRNFKRRHVIVQGIDTQWDGR